MTHRDTKPAELEEVVRRAITEELPKALEPFFHRITQDRDPNKPAPELLSRRRAAELLGVSVQTIASMLADGTLQCIRVRRRVLIPSQSIAEYLKGRSTDDIQRSEG